MSKPSLDFTLVNNYSGAEGKAIIYITPDESKNLLKLKVENDGDETATFTSNGVGIELLLAKVLPDDIIPNIQITCPSHWTATYSSSNKAWQLKPSQEIPLSSGRTIEFSLSKVAFPETVQPSTETLKLTYKIKEERRSKQKSLPVQLCKLPNTPGLPFLNNSVNCNFQKLDDWNVSDDGTQLLVPEKADDVVYINETNDSIIKTRLKFYLANEVAEAIAKGSNTKLQLSFQGGDDARDLASIGDGLTDNTDLADIELKFVSSSANNRWEVTKSPAGGVPIWTLTPKGSNVLNKNETVYFVLEDIKGNSIAGVSKMYLSYFDIPNYKDGYFATTIEKEQPYTQIIEFKVSNQNLLAKQPITFSWKVFAASKIELRADKGELNSHPIDVSSKTEHELIPPYSKLIPPYSDTEMNITYSLKAYQYDKSRQPEFNELSVKVKSLYETLGTLIKQHSLFQTSLKVNNFHTIGPNISRQWTHTLEFLDSGEVKHRLEQSDTSAKNEVLQRIEGFHLYPSWSIIKPSENSATPSTYILETGELVTNIYYFSEEYIDFISTGFENERYKKLFSSRSWSSPIIFVERYEVEYVEYPNLSLKILSPFDEEWDEDRYKWGGNILFWSEITIFKLDNDDVRWAGLWLNQWDNNSYELLTTEYEKFYQDDSYCHLTPETSS
ncbi:hypothetical protein [Scytonema sp. PCC 10023]|uniref:hypothetical protein n=1 Tax=Scytonema sp. PCC 10023 TaxID=1680591 RepID=UPI0039C5ECB2